MNSRALVIAASVVGVLIIGYGIIQAVKITRGPSKSPTITATASPTPSPISLLDYTDDDDSQVKVTILGRIVGKDQHIDQTLSVSKAARSFGVVKAYSGTLSASVDYDNNQPAYDDFMHALQNDGFVRTKTIPKNKPQPADDEVGLCPGGERYIYEVISGGQSIYRAWSTSCGDPTTFGGNPGAILALFKGQIPDYNKVLAAGRK